MEAQNLEGMVSGLLFLAGNAALAGAYIYGMIKYHEGKEERESRKKTKDNYELKTR